jgi:allantoicase
MLTFDFAALPWRPLLTEQPLQPDTQHVFRAEAGATGTLVRINVFPDGGVMRLHVWGQRGDDQ